MKRVSLEVAKAIKLHEKGIYTWVSLEPIITIAAAKEVINNISPFIDEVRIGLNSLKKDYTPQEVAEFKQWVKTEHSHLNVMWKESVISYISKIK